VPDIALEKKLTLLVKACYHNKAVARISLKVGPESFSAYGANFPQVFMYSHLQSYFQAYGDLPMWEWTSLRLGEMFSQVVGSPLESSAQELGMALVSPFSGAINIKFFSEMIADIYRKVIGNHILATAANEAIASGNYNVLRTQLAQVSSQATGVRESHSPLSKKRAVKLDVMSSGIRFIDSIFGGGIRRHNSYGILAPTGGGKTTFAGQLAILYGLQGIKVSLIFTEQSVEEPELIDRFWALITGHKSDDFAAYDDEDDFPSNLVTPEHWKIREVIDKHVKLYDFAKQPGDLEEIRSLASGSDGFKPDIVILDWAGKLAVQLIECGHKVADNETNALKYIASGMNEIAIGENVASVVFHQLRSDCKNPMSKYDHTDANGCKQFCHTLGYGVVIHPRDSNDITLIRTSKGRWCSRSDHLAKLRGAHSEFVEVTGYSKGRGRWEKDSSVGKMPDAPKASVNTGSNTQYLRGMQQQ
jgi:hypothetical protein